VCVCVCVLGLAGEAGWDNLVGPGNNDIVQIKGKFMTYG
jgi:hypothetical protein